MSVSPVLNSLPNLTANTANSGSSFLTNAGSFLNSATGFLNTVIPGASLVANVIPGFQGFLQTGSLTCLGKQAMDDANKAKWLQTLQTLAQAGNFADIEVHLNSWKKGVNSLKSVCSKKNVQECISYAEQLLQYKTQQTTIPNNTVTTVPNQGTNQNFLNSILGIWNGLSSVAQNSLKLKATENSKLSGLTPDNELQSLLGGIFNGTITIGEDGVIYDVSLTNQPKPNYLLLLALSLGSIFLYKTLKK